MQVVPVILSVLLLNFATKTFATAGDISFDGPCEGSRLQDWQFAASTSQWESSPHCSYDPVTNIRDCPIPPETFGPGSQWSSTGSVVASNRAREVGRGSGYSILLSGNGTFGSISSEFIITSFEMSNGAGACTMRWIDFNLVSPDCISPTPSRTPSSSNSVSTSWSPSSSYPVYPPQFLYKIEITDRVGNVYYEYLQQYDPNPCLGLKYDIHYRNTKFGLSSGPFTVRFTGLSPLYQTYVSNICISCPSSPSPIISPTPSTSPTPSISMTQTPSTPPSISTPPSSAPVSISPTMPCPEPSPECYRPCRDDDGVTININISR